MPMLALMLLFTGLFGDHGGPAEAAVRQQILHAQARGPTSSNTLRAGDSSSIQLYHLRQDRILQLIHQPLPQALADGRTQPAPEVWMVQLWDRVNGQWQLKRAVGIAPTSTSH